MALIIELGTPTVDADSFVDQTYLTEYFDKRGYVLPAEIDQALVLSFDFMKGLSWCAPHNVAFTVTEEMKKAQCEAVFSFSLDNPFVKTAVASNVKRVKEKLAVIEDEIEYFEGKTEIVSNASVLAGMPKVSSLLGSLLCGSSGKYIGRA